MKAKTFIAIFSFILISSTAFIFKPETIPESIQGDGYVIDTLAENLRVPWQIAFLPDGTMLFTEREGRLRIYRNGKLVDKPAFEIAVPLDNKSGLLGLCIHPDFARNKFIYLASNYMSENKMRLRVTRYQFVNDTLANAFPILKNLPANRNHTGCRLKFGPDKKLYVTTGDADEPALAQDLKAYNGKILRLNDDGSIPADNPFVKSDSAIKAIWTYGHRNPQGLAFQPGTNYLFNSEHGPTGGDEINFTRKGMNYGWPVIHHQDTKDGMVSPIAEYTPSIGPAEAMFYTAKEFPQLRGHLLVACLRGESILDITMDKEKIISQNVMFKKEYGRIRSVVTGPDGFIYFSTSQNDPPEGTARPHYDMILRMRPAGNGSIALSSQKLISEKAISSPQKQSGDMITQQLCASCHGNNLAGTDRGSNLVTANLAHGSDKKTIVNNITNGIIDKGMPAWKGAISPDYINKIADYILTKRKESVSK